MFTEGLDNSSLRWVREKEVPFSNSNLRPRMDPLIGIRSGGGGGRGFGLPPPSKFRSGHLPTNAIPVSRTIPGDDTESASDNDFTSEDEGVYGRRYSLDSSPQDDRVPGTTAQRFGNGLHGRPRYMSDSMYSDVSSSMETVAGRQGQHLADRLVRGNGRYPVTRHGFTEDESSDSAASSEFSTTQVGGTAPRARGFASEGYASSVQSRMNVESSAVKNENFSDGDNDDDVPSAPPFCGSAQEIKQSAEHIPASSVHATPQVAESNSFSTRNDPNASISKNMPGIKVEDKTDQPVRSTAGVEAAVPSGSNPARVPTFHASALGPWHAVLAYDACVRLCLHAWARGCMEAPMFLENECALLRDSFG